MVGKCSQALYRRTPHQQYFPPTALNRSSLYKSSILYEWSKSETAWNTNSGVSNSYKCCLAFPAVK